ncbi:winged helix-turn-helix domain-containing protein [Avibacterium paragallinarum]|uniref:Response regulator n=1 Tax=Avibacterium paragallinarum TaxID=728 RepID=A0A0F5EYS1_AVIPA|nr:winged helix-turn-helix domain-containing protein [Avibacterium paragallinarum]KAA6208207.1 response regulator [Avibacterium paragallinarum]KKB01082.1 hypothetical protein Z012_08555 [Avibacterium paragallinarum]POY45290.1 DNA-binding response regulator [Avibacterium paragallinarum]RZN55613.1 response regulator [Avibacterium paragallinarum]RZN59755.1 response regulator [Avibacterium paragallinarum]
MTRLLLINAGTSLVYDLIHLLHKNNFEVEETNEQDVLNQSEEHYHLAILDISHTKSDRTVILRQIREHFTIPIIVITAGNAMNRITCLELGADDCLSQPFNERELITRINAILRRINVSSHTLKKSQENYYITYSELVLDIKKQQASHNDQDLGLTSTEFILLQLLITHPGQILSREYLSINALGKHITPFDRSIDMHISNLRKKLPRRKDNNLWVKTQRGKGYQLI